MMLNELFKMIYQEFKALGRKYLVLPNSGISCKELREGEAKLQVLRLLVQFLLRLTEDEHK